jgi:hypothetical protein
MFRSPLRPEANNQAVMPIHQNADRSDDHHRHPADRLRLEEALDGLPSDRAKRQQQES